MAFRRIRVALGVVRSRAVLLTLLVIFLGYGVDASPPGTSDSVSVRLQHLTTGNPVGGAILRVRTQFYSADSQGIVLVSVEPGDTVSVQAAGFRDLDTVLVAIPQNRYPNLVFNLTPQSYSVEGMTIFGIRDFLMTPGRIEVAMPLTKTALRMTWNDPVRLASVAANLIPEGSDLSTRFSLRGGRFDETMIALDGVPIYNPFHLATWLSSFDESLISSITLYKSNYPPRYEDRLSGLLLLSSPEPLVYPRNSVGLSLTGANGNLGVSWGDVSMFLSVRRFWFDVLDFIAPSIDFPYSFTDLFGKIQYRMSDRTVAKLEVFDSKDVLNPFVHERSSQVEVAKEPNWGSILLRGSIESELSRSMSLEVSFYTSKWSMVADADGIISSIGAPYPNSMKANNHMIERSVDVVSSMIVSKHVVTGGVNLKDRVSHFDWAFDWNVYPDPIGFLIPRSNMFFDFAPDTVFRSFTSHSISVFIQDEVTFRPDLRMTLGVRTTKYSKSSSLLLSPYVELSYSVVPLWTLSISGGRYYQTLYSLSDVRLDNNSSRGFAVPFLATSRSEVATSDHVRFGVRGLSSSLSAKWEMEFYYKSRRRIPSAYRNAKENVYRRFEDGRAYGIDASYSMNIDPFRVNLAISYGRSLRLNARGWYSSSEDRPFSASLAWTTQLFDWLSMTSLLVTGSGAPYTAGTGVPSGDSPVILEGSKNRSRSDNYFRLDVSFQCEFESGGMNILPYLALYNATNSRNPVLFDGAEQKNNSYQFSSAVIPTLGIKVEF